jgi:preprotein translocase subunit Sec61beta
MRINSKGKFVAGLMFAVATLFYYFDYAKTSLTPLRYVVLAGFSLASVLILIDALRVNRRNSR